MLNQYEKMQNEKIKDHWKAKLKYKTVSGAEKELNLPPQELWKRESFR